MEKINNEMVETGETDKMGEMGEMGETDKAGETGGKWKNCLKHVCGRLSPMKRLVSVLLVCCVLATASIYFLVSAIIGVGKNDAGKKAIKLEHIETLELPKKERIYILKHQEHVE